MPGNLPYLWVVRVGTCACMEGLLICLSLLQETHFALPKACHLPSFPLFQQSQGPYFFPRTAIASVSPASDYELLRGRGTF